MSVVCDIIIVSTVSQMLHTVAAIVTVSLSTRWWSWAHLCCVWKLQNLSLRQKSRLRDVKRADFIQYWWRSGLKNLDKPKNFLKKNVRNHSYHQFYPVLAKIRINWIQINWGLLHVIFNMESSDFVHICNMTHSASFTNRTHTSWKQLNIPIEPLYHKTTRLMKKYHMDYYKLSISYYNDLTMSLTLWELAYDIFVLQFRPKKQQFSVALPTP